MMPPAGVGAGARALLAAARAMVLLYVAGGVLVMWLLAPRVPYADGWRYLARFLREPFPRDILAPDNGHHEVLPNIVRALDLRLFDAGQQLQVLAGIVLALATLLVYWRGIRGLASAPQRIAGLLAVALGLFWLGNVRALAHGNESVHAYCVTLFLALGLHALVRGRGLAGGVAVAAACGLAATFSFGSGIACFAGFAAALSLRRGGWRQWSVLAAGLLLSLLLLHWTGGSGGGARLAPLQQLPMLLAWLAGPLLYAAWPVLDPQVAGQLPVAAARMPAQALAGAYQSAFGPAVAAPWPQALAGLLGLAWLALLGWRAWHTHSAAMLAGVGTACFAAAVGVMIVLVRLDYFETYPEQLLAARYLVWSSLFWAGLLLATAAGARHGVRALAGVVLVAVLLLPSQAWMAVLGAKMRMAADQAAMAGTVGVVEPELVLGETLFEELAEALPAAREAGVAGFAWPEARWLGRRLPPDAPRLAGVESLEATVVANRLGADGRRLHFEADAPCRRLLLADGDGTVSGLAMHARASGRHWTGWMRGVGEVPPRVAACAPSR